MKTKHKCKWLGKSYVAVEERDDDDWLVGWTGLPECVSVVYDDRHILSFECWYEDENDTTVRSGVGKSLHMALRDLEEGMLSDFKDLGKVLGYEVVG